MGEMEQAFEKRQKGMGDPPFNELKSLIELAGYKVMSIGVESAKLGFCAAISLKIAPKEWLDQTEFISFPQIPQDLISRFREKQTPESGGRGIDTI